MLNETFQHTELYRPVSQLFEDLKESSQAFVRVGVACSGGVDSMLLVQVAHEISRHNPLRFEIVVLTVDHGLHEHSSENAYQVCAYWRRLGIDSLHLYANPTLIEQGSGIEDGARHARYHAIEEAVIRLSLSAVLFAHHAGDQAETLIMRLQGPSGLRGLSGIPMRRDWVRRPWLKVDPSLIREAHTAKGLSCFEDPTNKEQRFLRNAIRHQLYPSLNQVFEPGWALRISESASYLSEASTLLDYFLKQFTSEMIDDRSQDGQLCLTWIDRGALTPPMLKSAALRYFYSKALYSLSEERDQRRIKEQLPLLEALWWNEHHSSHSLPHGLVAWGGCGQLFICCPRRLPPLPKFIEIKLIELKDRDHELSWGEWSLSFVQVKSIDRQREAEPHQQLSISLHPQTVTFPLKLSLPLSGAKFRPAHAPGRKRIKRLWGDLKVPIFERERLPVLSDATDQVLWAPRCRPAHHLINEEAKSLEFRFYLRWSRQT